MDRLRIGYLSTMYHTSHILKHNKWVEEYISLEGCWNLFGTGPSMVEAFAADELDIGYIGLPPAMIGIGRGLPLVCIAGGHAEGTVMIARKGYRTARQDEETGTLLQQFRRKSLGAPSVGSIHDVIARYLISRSGFDDIAVKNYPWADLIPDAIEDGEIEGAFGTPPLAVLAGTWYGHEVVMSPGRLWPFNPSYGIVVRREMFNEEKVLEKFLVIHEKACNLIVRQPDEAARAVAGEVQVVEPDFVKKVFNVSPRYCAFLPPEYIDATMRFLPALRQMGYLDRDLAVDEVFDLSLIKKIHPEGHHYLMTLQG